jgi:Ca2+-binding EF-hand superfamily protein
MSKAMAPGKGWWLAALLATTTAVAADEADAGAEAEQRRQGERWFRSYDADVDGFISRDEYLAVEMKKVEKRFKFIDTTRDGYISANEAIAAKKKLNKLRGITAPAGETNNETPTDSAEGE